MIQIDSEIFITAKGNIYIPDLVDRSMKISIHLFMVLITSIMYFIFNYSLSIDGSKNDWKNIFFLIILASLIPSNLCLYKLKKFVKTSNLTNEHIYIINNQGVCRFICEKKLFIPWSNIIMIEETNKLFKIKVIYKGKVKPSISKELININYEFDSFELHNPFLIPKRFFENDNDLECFKELVRINKKN